MNRRISFAIGTVATLALLVGVSVSAQTDLGLQAASGNIGLAEGNLTLMIARVIRAFFGLLGITAVCLIAYGGFTWMTAGGSDEKVDQAKKIMINGTIGLMVILSSFAIASFVVNAIVNGTTGGVGGTGDTSGGTGGAGGGLPGGSSSVMVVRMPSSTKAGYVPEFNLYFYKGFGEAASPKLSTVIFNQTIFLTKNNVEEPVDLETDGNMVKLKAKTVCPKNNKNTPFCFGNDSEYVLTVKDGIAGITTEDGLPLQCDSANPCTVIVKTGNLDDATKPSADISYLHQKGGVGAQFSNGSVLPLDTDFVGHSQTKDDTEVKHISVFKGNTLYGYYQAKQGVDGYYPAETEITFPWTTKGLKLFQSDSIQISATDTSNNESEKRSFNYTTQGAQCSDGIQNTGTTKPAGDETGVDCGGTSCLSCNGGGCSADSQCASGICDKKTNQCTEDPVIFGVHHNDGAPGSVVTIIGKGFGTEKGSGAVTFGVGATEKNATVASCGNVISWGNNEIIAIVPAGATTGGVKVMRKDGKTDSTIDSVGPKLSPFTVNQVVRPGILCVSPKEGFFGTALTITGSGFGATQDANSRIAMGDVFITPKQWSDTSITTTIPSIPAGTHAVVVNRGAEKSNPASVKVKEGSGTTQPTVSTISPAKTTPGSVVVLSGNGFGDTRGVVYFGDKLGDFSLPAECSTNAWTNNRIVVRVPQGVTGSVAVTVERVSPVVKSKAASIVIEDGAPNPSICNISPDNGPTGSKVKITGENFGNEKGTVTLEGTNLSVGEWGQSSIGSVTIESAAKTGYVTVATNQSQISNGFPFVVQDCKVAGCGNGGTCCDSGSAKGSCVPKGAQCPGSAGVVAANYSWLFSTGDIPVIPSLVFQCGNAIVPSPAPWSGRNGGNDACVNAKITGVFTTTVRDFTLGKDIVVEKCEDEACEKTTNVDGVLTTNAAQGLGFEIAPSKKLDANTRYRVTLSTNITGVKLSGSGKPLTMAKDDTCKKPSNLGGEASACFTFKTRASAEECEVTDVLVDPTLVNADALGQVMQSQDKTSALVISASGKGKDACVLFNTNGGDWSYNTVSDANPTSVTLGATGQTHTRTVTALKEHPANSKGYVFNATYTNPRGKKVNGEGSVKVSLARPEIISYSPNCNAACINGDMQIGFNVAMDSATLQSNILVEQCTEESCTATQGPVSVQSVIETNTQGKAVYIIELANEFKAGSWYKATVRGGDNGVKSKSGGSLANTNANTNFVWKFRTRNSGDECVVKSVDVVPVEGRVKSIGSSIMYRAVPRTAPDSCDPNGQTLSANSYAWNWSVADQNVATVTNNDKGEMPQYCTNSCALAGSNFYKAICGDGVVTAPHEMCDGGVNCTANCLLKGNTALSCGNGIVEKELGESCDDKNLVSGDGCSKICLQEGGASGSVCGNGDIGLGEMCDDGNTANGDGCSSQCLSEGSVRFDPKCADVTSNSPTSLTSQCVGVIFASCGNKVVESGESCDEGLRCENGAACSKDSDCARGVCKPRTTETCTDRCLNPKFIPTSSSASCGNGVIDVAQGEQCDPVVDGDARIDASQKVTAVGKSTVVAGEQKTLVKAAVIADKANKPQNAVGEGSFILQCGFLNDSDCSLGVNGEDMGLASNSCCGIRPKMVKSYPENNSTNVCTNTAVWTETSAPLDHATLVGNVGLYIKVADGTTSCPGDTGAPIILAADTQKLGWWQKMVDSFMQYVRGRAVYAEITACPSPVKGTVKAITDGEKTRILFSPTALLNKNTEYYFGVKGGANGAKSAQGIAFSSGYKTVTFKTGSELCELKGVSLDTEDYLFSRQNENHQFVAKATSKNGAELSPIPGVYNWNYEWVATNEEPSGLYLYGENSEKSNKPTSVVSSQNVLSTATQGTGQVSVITTITDDGDTNTKGKEFVATAELTSIFCENPWPKLNNNSGKFTDRSGASYSSQFGNNFSLAGGATNPVFTNFAFSYCKDQGAANLVSDDLPSLQPVVIGNPPDSATTLKEFFFSPVNEQGARINKDVIGIRVEKNFDHLPIEKWYQSRGFTGTPTPIVVDGFSAIQDGRTVYISGINATLSGRTVTELRTNVYVISYNQGADPTTVAIFNQILKNFKLAINVKSTNLCYKESDVSGVGVGQLDDGDTLVASRTSCTDDMQCGIAERCDSVKLKSLRDVQRLADASTLESLLQKYFDARGTYPVLGSGSYLPGQTVSTWKSWQAALGNELKTSLPVDPVNKLRECSDADAEEGTCWNATKGTYACPSGSHMYAYETKKNGQDFLLKSQFELSTSVWKNNELNNPRLVTSGACTNISVSAATVGQCGNNILETGEECDPKGSTVKEVVGGKTLTYICQANCTKGTPVSQAGAMCGNGVLDAGELCDDGKDNGSYGFCNATCTTRLACGDGIIQNQNSNPKGPEVCEVKRCTGNSAISCSTNADCKKAISVGTAALEFSKCTATDLKVGGMVVSKSYDCGVCEDKKGTVYAPTKEQSCNWDCRSFGPYCGDGIKNGTEQCDVGAGGGAVALDCTLTTGAPGQKKGSCKNDCTWNVDAESASCEALPATVAGGVPVVTDGCGDGEIDKGEECDLGGNNGVKCSAPYMGTCPYCSAPNPATGDLGCKTKVISGARCGDGILNGAEKCDGADLGGADGLAMCKEFGFDAGKPSCSSQCSGISQNGCVKCGYTDKGTSLGNVRVVTRNGLSTTGTGTISSSAFVLRGGALITNNGVAEVKSTTGVFNLDMTIATDDAGKAQCTGYTVQVGVGNFIQQASGTYTNDKTSEIAGENSFNTYNTFLFEKSKLPSNSYALVTAWDGQVGDVDVMLYATNGKQTLALSKQQFSTCSGVKCMKYGQTTAATLDRTDTAAGGYETLRFYAPKNGLYEMDASLLYIVKVTDNTNKKFADYKSKLRVGLYNANGLVKGVTLFDPREYTKFKNSSQASMPPSDNSVYFLMVPSADKKSLIPLF